jgi:energy-converting hydrogenase Eha subunit H
MNVSSETLWSDIQELAELKYQVSYSITWGICTTGIIRDSLEVELVHFITLLSICHMGNIATISFVWGPLFYCLC